jgi:hypothetical protein
MIALSHFHLVLEHGQFQTELIRLELLLLVAALVVVEMVVLAVAAVRYAPIQIRLLLVGKPHRSLSAQAVQAVVGSRVALRVRTEQQPQSQA